MWSDVTEITENVFGAHLLCRSDNTVRSLNTSPTRNINWTLSWVSSLNLFNIQHWMNYCHTVQVLLNSEVGNKLGEGEVKQAVDINSIQSINK